MDVNSAEVVGCIVKQLTGDFPGPDAKLCECETLKRVALSVGNRAIALLESAAKADSVDETAALELAASVN